MFDRSPTEAQPFRDGPAIMMVGCDPAAPGGISTVIRLLMRSSLSQHWRIESLPTWVSGSRTRRAFAYAGAVARLCWLAQRGQLQAVHLHMAARGSFWRKWFIRQVLRPFDVRVLVHLHDGTLPQWHASRPAWVQRLFRGLLEQADAVIALSPTWQDRIRPLAPQAQWAVVRNPVMVPQSAPRPPATEARQILFLGRLWLDKGLDELLCAAQVLQPQHPDWHWTLAGDGDEASIRRRLRQHGLEGVVTLAGWLDEPAKQRALRVADVLVLPSHAEGQPLAVIEAMARGVPVVATAVGDIPELLACGAGLVVPLRDPPALAQALQAVLNGPNRAHAMGQCGRRYVLQHHRLEVVADQLDALYRQLALQPHGHCRLDQPFTGA